MWTAILVAAGNGLKAAGAYFHWAAGRSDLNNTPAMQAAAAAGTAAKIEAKATADTLNPNPQALEEDIAG